MKNVDDEYDEYDEINTSGLTEEDAAFQASRTSFIHIKNIISLELTCESDKARARRAILTMTMEMPRHFTSCGDENLQT